MIFERRGELRNSTSGPYDLNVHPHPQCARCQFTACCHEKPRLFETCQIVCEWGRVERNRVEMVPEGEHAVLRGWNEQIAFTLSKMYRLERWLCKKIKIIVLISEKFLVIFRRRAFIFWRCSDDFRYIPRMQYCQMALTENLGRF